MAYKIVAKFISRVDEHTFNVVNEFVPFSIFRTSFHKALPDRYEWNAEKPNFLPGNDNFILELDDSLEVITKISSQFGKEWNNRQIQDLLISNTRHAASATPVSVGSVPIPSNLYIDQKVWDFIITTIRIGKYPLFIGPKGCGKTETGYSVAEALGYQFFTINCGSLFKPKLSLIGSMQASEGTTYMVDSEFMTYFTSDKPTIIFLDELSRIPAAAANYMMTILDRKQSYIYIEEQGKRVYKGKDVIFVAAANFGIEYTDTRQQDGAFLDRFIKFYVDYLSEDKEISLVLLKIPKIRRDDASRLTKIIRKCRANKDLGTSVSTRQLLDMAEYLVNGFTVAEIAEHILLNIFINGSDDRRVEVEQFLNAEM